MKWVAGLRGWPLLSLYLPCGHQLGAGFGNQPVIARDLQTRVNWHRWGVGGLHSSPLEKIHFTELH